MKQAKAGPGFRILLDFPGAIKIFITARQGD
jgi:hypothetical protein